MKNDNTVASIVLGRCSACKTQLPVQIIYYNNGTFKLRRLNSETADIIYAVPLMVNNKLDFVACCCKNCAAKTKINTSVMLRI